MPALPSVLPWSSPSHVALPVSLPHLATSELLSDGRSEHRKQNRVQSASSWAGRKVCALHVGASLIRPSGLIPYLALD